MTATRRMVISANVTGAPPSIRLRERALRRCAHPHRTRRSRPRRRPLAPAFVHGAVVGVRRGRALEERAEPGAIAQTLFAARLAVMRVVASTRRLPCGRLVALGLARVRAGSGARHSGRLESGDIPAPKRANRASRQTGERSDGRKPTSLGSSPSGSSSRAPTAQARKPRAVRSRLGRSLPRPGLR